MRADFVNDNVTVSKLRVFYGEQDKWTRAMIKNHPSDEDAYWRHVDYIMTQFDGLYAGYRAAALPQWVGYQSISQSISVFCSGLSRKNYRKVHWRRLANVQEDQLKIQDASGK